MMKRFLTTVTVVLTSLYPGHAQEDAAGPAAGFLQVMNLVSQKSPTFLTLNDFDFNRGEPIETGSGSGTLALRPGEFELKLTNAAAKKPTATLPVTIENGKTTIIICYDEVTTLDDGSEEVSLQFSQLVEAPETTTARLTVVSLLERETVPLTIKGRPFRAAPKSPIKADLSGAETTSIKSNGKTLIDFESDRLGHYLVFLYENPESGEMSASLIQNEKLEYQAPLEEDEEIEGDGN